MSARPSRSSSPAPAARSHPVTAPAAIAVWFEVCPPGIQAHRLSSGPGHGPRSPGELAGELDRKPTHMAPKGGLCALLPPSGHMFVLQQTPIPPIGRTLEF